MWQVVQNIPIIDEAADNSPEFNPTDGFNGSSEEFQQYLPCERYWDGYHPTSWSDTYHDDEGMPFE